MPSILLQTPSKPCAKVTPTSRFLAARSFQFWGRTMSQSMYVYKRLLLFDPQNIQDLLKNSMFMMQQLEYQSGRRKKQEANEGWGFFKLSVDETRVEGKLFSFLYFHFCIFIFVMICLRTVFFSRSPNYSSYSRPQLRMSRPYSVNDFPFGNASLGVDAQLGASASRDHSLTAANSVDDTTTTVRTTMRASPSLGAKSSNMSHHWWYFSHSSRTFPWHIFA